MTTPNPFDKPTGLPSISFAITDPVTQRSVPVAIGTRLGGRVTKAPEVVQARGYEGADKGKPLFWDNLSKGLKTPNDKDAQGRDNNPVQQIVINMMCPDGEERALWVPFYPKSMFEAIVAALAGRAIEVGDDLFVTITGFTPVAGKNPMNDYSADFTKGAGVFAAPADPAPPAPPAAPAPPPPAPVPAPPVAVAPPPPAPVPAPPAPPAPAPPPAAPATPEGYTLASLVAAGWSAEQAVATYPILGAAASNGAAHNGNGDDARAAKIAAMSDEDRELLGLAK